jgi:hypothetical protein
MCFAVVSVTLTLLFLQSAAGAQMKEANEENCEVCVKFLRKFAASLDGSKSSDPKYVEKEFKKTCKTAKKDDNRFCYYIGGTEDSATSILNEVTKPLSYSLPPEKICMKLHKKDSQICELKYEKMIDLTNVNLKKLKVKDLKKILSDWEEQCKGCTEKSDFVDRVEELLPQYDPKAAAARAKNEL